MKLDFETEHLVRLLKQSVDAIYREEPLLTQKVGLEQACVFRVGIYLQNMLDRNEGFRTLNLDCEYNKNLDKTKCTANYPDGIRPDLLIHRRNTHEHNKVAAEFKGWWNNNEADDIQKLKDLTDVRLDYKYKLGVFVKLGKNTAFYRFFQDGSEVAND